MHNLCIGFNHTHHDKLLDMCRKYTSNISTVYFAWPTIGSGRGCSEYVFGRSSQHLIIELLNDLSYISKLGIKLDLLLNSSCFGNDSLSRSLITEFCEIIDTCNAHGATINNITLMSHVVAKELKHLYPNIHFKCSINNHSLSSVRQFDVLKDYYDGFYYNRDYNYDFETLKSVSSWCKQNDKQLYMLANSGCITDCPVRQLHQNIAAHQKPIFNDNSEKFTTNVAICGEYVSDHKQDFLSYSNIVRPEDIHLWEPYVDGIKLATRASDNFVNIVEAYINESYDDDLCGLTEPATIFSFSPSIINNKSIPSDYAETRIHNKCGSVCYNCGFCRKIMSDALKTLSINEWLATHESFLIPLHANTTISR